MLGYIYDVFSTGILYIASGVSSVIGGISDLFKQLTYVSLYNQIQDNFIYKGIVEFLGMLWNVIEFILDILHFSIGNLHDILSGIYNKLLTTQFLVIFFCILILWIAGYLLKAFLQPIYWVLRPFVILCYKTLKFFLFKIVRIIKKHFKRQLRKFT